MDTETTFYNDELEEIVRNISVNISYVTVLNAVAVKSASDEEAKYYLKRIVSKFTELGYLPNIMYSNMIRYLKKCNKWDGRATRKMTLVLDICPVVAHPSLTVTDGYYTLVCRNAPMEFNEILISYLNTEKDIDKSIEAFNSQLKPGDTCQPSKEEAIMKLFEQQRQVIKRRYCKQPSH